MPRWLAIALTAAAILAASPPRAAQAWSDFCCLPWAQPAQLAITPDGRFAYASDYKAVLALARNTQTGGLRVVDSYSVHGGGTTELSPDGRTLYIAASQYGTLAEFRRDETTGKLTPIGEYDSGKPGPAYIARYRDIAFTADGRTAYLSWDDMVETATRDPDTGLLSHRGEVHAQAPTALELSHDERFLYALQKGGAPLLVFARAGDGSLAQVQQLDAGSVSDLALSPDGARLYAGPQGPSTFSRDASSGMLTRVGSGSFYSEDVPHADGQILVSPDGAAVYTLDHRNNHLYQYATTADGVRFAKTYRENADGQGFLLPTALSSSPDGAFVYVASDSSDSGRKPSHVAVFRRDPGTDHLSFASIYDGPFFDGRAPWEVTEPAITINGGARYTDDPDVTLTVTGVGGPSASAVLVSNDGGFSREASAWLPLGSDSDDVFPWRLATSGPERLPKVVYMRAQVGSEPRLVTDEIVLDQRPPELLSAEQVGGSLRIRARDRLSGLKQLQVTRDRRKPGRWRPFKRRVRVSMSHRHRYVRVRDGAGNRSHWFVVRRRR